MTETAVTEANVCATVTSYGLQLNPSASAGVLLVRTVVREKESMAYRDVIDFRHTDLFVTALYFNPTLTNCEKFVRLSSHAKVILNTGEYRVFNCIKFSGNVVCNE